MQSGFPYFQPSQVWRQAAKISDGLKKRNNHFYIVSGIGCEDSEFGEKIRDYASDEKSIAILIDLAKKTRTDFKSVVSELIAALDLKRETEEEAYRNLAGYMHSAFKAGYLLVLIIVNAEKAETADFDYLYQTSQIIYDRYPNLKNKPLFKFVFLGSEPSMGKVRKAGFKPLEVLPAPRYERTDIINHISFLFPELHEKQSLTEECADALLKETGGLPVPIRFALEQTARKKQVDFILKPSEILIEKMKAVFLPEFEDTLRVLKQNHPSPYNKTLIYAVLFLALALILLIFYLFYSMFSNFL